MIFGWCGRGRLARGFLFLPSEYRKLRRPKVIWAGARDHMKLDGPSRRF